MRRIATLTVFLAVSGFGWAAVIEPSASPKSVSDEHIQTLIQRLTHGSYKVRIAASRELDSLGSVALPALQKAASSDDPESRARASELAVRIAVREQMARLLAPALVELKHTDAPLADVVSDLAWQSQYNVVLQGDASLSQRKVTIATGKVPFWTALQQLCQVANVRENTDSAAGINTGEAVLPLHTIDEARDVRQLKLEEIRKLKEQIKQIQQAQQPLPGGLRQPVRIPPRPAVEEPRVPSPSGASKPLPNRYPLTIVLVDGKAVPMPQAVSGCVRVRAWPVSGLGDSAVPFGPALRQRQLNDIAVMPAGMAKPGWIGGEVGEPLRVENAAMLVLDILPEPRLSWNQVFGVSLSQATDDQGQELEFVGSQFGPAVFFAHERRRVGYNYGVVHPGMRQFPVWLKRGEKTALTLKTVRGTFSARVIVPPEPLATIPDVLNAKGKTVKGLGNTTLRLHDVSRNAQTGEVKIHVEFSWSMNDVQVAQQLVLPGEAPVAPQVKAPPIVNGQALARQRNMANGYQGLFLLNDKNQPFQIVGMTHQPLPWNGTTAQQNVTLTYRPTSPDQMPPTKLIFAGSRFAVVDVPFELRDVPVAMAAKK